MMDMTNALTQPARACHRRYGEEEAELRRRRARTAHQNTTQNRRSRTARARHKRQHLEQTNHQCHAHVNQLDILDAGAAVRVLPLLHQNERYAVKNQHRRDHRSVMQVRIHPVVKRNTDDCTGQNGDHDLEPQHNGVHLKQPDEALALFGHFEGPELGEVQQHNRQNRAELNDHLEHGLKRIGHLQLNELIQQNHVSRRADGQPLGNALHNAEEQCLQRFNKQIHLFFSYLWGKRRVRWGRCPQTPAKNLMFLDFPHLYRFSIKGMTLFLRFIPVLKRKWHLKKGCREQGSLPSPLKLKLLRRADCELFRLHRRVLRRRGTRLLLPLADSLLRRLLSLRAHPPHQTVHRRHPR